MKGTALCLILVAASLLLLQPSRPSGSYTQTAPGRQAVPSDCLAGWREYKGQTGVTCVAPDPQGHLPAAFDPHGPPCPGQYEYRDTDGFIVFCWGHK